MHAVVTVAVILGGLAPLTTLGQSTAVVRETTTVRSYDGRTATGEIVRLAVPERRTSSARTVTVAALRLSSTAERPGTPIVFLMGGPGIPGSVMARVPPYFTLFERLRSIADVIIVDQRGIGLSTPNLDCPFDGTLPDSALVVEGPLVVALRGQVANCAERWRQADADPAAYTTLESADDVDDLRQALGAERIDLVAFSYGTRLALAVLQRHGAHVGRLVLQGINGPGLVLKRPIAIARKLQLVSRLLDDDTLWPPTNLLEAARAARARLAATPVAITLTDRRTGQQRQVLVGRYGLDAIVSVSPDDQRLPALLVSVAAGDDRLLARFAEELWNGLTTGTVGLMARAVNCAADRPESRRALIAREAQAAPFGNPLDNAVLTNEFCAAIGFQAPTVEFPTPVNSPTPALLLTGSLDATNPVENAQAIARGLRNAVQLEIVNAAHEGLPVPAVQDVVVDFLSGHDVRGRNIVAAVPRFPTVEAALVSGSRRAP